MSAFAPSITPTALRSPSIEVFYDAKTAPKESFPERPSRRTTVGSKSVEHIKAAAAREAKPASDAVSSLPLPIQELFIKAAMADESGKTTGAFTDSLLSSLQSDPDTHAVVIAMLNETLSMVSESPSHSDAVVALDTLREVFDGMRKTADIVEAPLAGAGETEKAPADTSKAASLFSTSGFKKGLSTLAAFAKLASAGAQETCTNPTPEQIDDMCSRRNIASYEKLATEWLREACKVLKREPNADINQLCQKHNLRGKTMMNCAQKLTEAVGILESRGECVPKEDSFWATKEGEAVYVLSAIALSILILTGCCMAIKYKEEGRCWG
jgi:hypothetical protein